MPIKFEPRHDQGCFLAVWRGGVTDTDMLSDYRRFFASDDWQPGFNELSDFTQADLRHVTGAGLKQLAEFVAAQLRRHGVDGIRRAAYVDDDHAYGLMRMYDAYADGSPESTEVFRDLEEAKAWLLQDEPQARRTGSVWFALAPFTLELDSVARTAALI